MGRLITEINAYRKDNGGAAKTKKEATTWYTEGLKVFSKTPSDNAKTNMRFRPGHIYIFRYTNPITEATLDWWDKNPMVLALDPSKEAKHNDLGINLNLLPIRLRTQLLDKVYDVYKNQIEAAKKAKPSDALHQKDLKITYKDAYKFLYKFGFEFAIRQYSPKLKTKQSVVSYESWVKVAQLDLLKLNGSSVASVRKQFSDYFKNRDI
jgi:hypothetical protein